MATIIHTVRVVVTRLSTLMALRNNIVGNTFSQTMVENEILTDEFTFDIFFLDLFSIIDDATFQLEHIFKTLMFEIG